jgi:hypothetical protein
VVLDFKNLTSCWFNIRPQDYYIEDSGSNSEAWVIVPGIREPYPKTWTLEIQDPGPGSSTTIAENTTNTATSSSTSAAETAPTQSQATTSVGSLVPTVANTNLATTTAANFHEKINPGHGHGLETGAKAGIGISITILVLGSASFAFYLLARRNQRREMALSNDTSEITFQPPQAPTVARIVSSTPSYHSAVPITLPSRALLEQMKLEEEQSMSPEIPSMRNDFERGDSPRTQSVVGNSLRHESFRDERVVELSHVDSALHELYSPLEIHEIGPGKWENTGFNFPPEKSARC